MTQSDSQSVPLSLAMLDRYLAGESGPEEYDTVQRWIAANPDAEHRIAWRSHSRGWDIEAAVAGLKRQMDQEKIPQIIPSYKPRVRRRIAAFVGAAAVVVGGFILASQRSDDLQPSLTRQYITGSGQRATIDLPDGSHVVLAPQTTVEFSAIADGIRTVKLDGEAYFTVAPDSRRGFVVQAGSVATTVLGTAFNVRRYESDSVAQVAVTSGKVRTQAGSDALTLVPGDVALATDSAVSMIKSSSIRDVTAWTEGQLIFSDAPVLTVLETVGRWYGYEFKLADSALAKRHVTFAISAERPLRTTLRYLQDLLDVTITIQDQTAILRPRSPNTNSRRTTPVKSELPRSLPALSEMGK